MNLKSSCAALTALVAVASFAAAQEVELVPVTLGTFPQAPDPAFIRLEPVEKGPEGAAPEEPCLWSRLVLGNKSYMVCFTRVDSSRAPEDGRAYLDLDNDLDLKEEKPAEGVHHAGYMPGTGYLSFIFDAVPGVFEIEGEKLQAAMRIELSPPMIVWTYTVFAAKSEPFHRGVGPAWLPGGEAGLLDLGSGLAVNALHVGTDAVTPDPGQPRIEGGRVFLGYTFETADAVMVTMPEGVDKVSLEDDRYPHGPGAPRTVCVAEDGQAFVPEGKFRAIMTLTREFESKTWFLGTVREGLETYEGGDLGPIEPVTVKVNLKTAEGGLIAWPTFTDARGGSVYRLNPGEGSFGKMTLTVSDGEGHLFLHADFDGSYHPVGPVEIPFDGDPPGGKFNFRLLFEECPFELKIPAVGWPRK